MAFTLDSNSHNKLVVLFFSATSDKQFAHCHYGIHRTREALQAVTKRSVLTGVLRCSGELPQNLRNGAHDAVTCPSCPIEHLRLRCCGPELIAIVSAHTSSFALKSCRDALKSCHDELWSVSFGSGGFQEISIGW